MDKNARDIRLLFNVTNRQFISGIDQESAKREFLRSILDAARSLDYQLIAEGVETAAEHLFKAINDRLGSSVGDALLSSFAQRISHLLFGDDVLARVGGNEFVLLSICVPVMSWGWKP